NTITVTIVGDSNSASSFDPATSTGADAAATIGSGNDSIAVTNTSMTVSGGNFGPGVPNVMIVGDHNLLSRVLPAKHAPPTIGGGTDSITVADCTASTTGAPSNQTAVEIRGEEIQAVGPVGASTTSTIGGGNDTIGVTNVPIVADGPFADLAALVVRSEYVVQVFGSGASTVGGGN